jgi:hypothetical protein
VTEIASGEIPNPPYLKFVAEVFAVCIFFVAFGVAGFVLSDSSLVLWGMTILAVVTFLVIWHREYYNRPKHVWIEKGGIRLVFRYKSPRFVSWDEMRWVSAPPIDPATSKGKYDRDGYLQLKGRTFYPLYWKLAQEVRHAYRDQVGEYPPMRDEPVGWKHDNR